MSRKTQKKLRKLLTLVSCAVLLVCVTIGATVAYLTAQDKVVNTFTVGKVDITLDEAEVNADGKPIDADGKVVEDLTTAKRVDANNYHLLPSHKYTKDPTVTVLGGSEECYVKMTVTFSKAAELDTIFAPNGADMTRIFEGYNPSNWLAKGNTKDTEANTRTYEFWYKGAVPAAATNTKLEPLFTSITVPNTITNEQLATIEGMTITVNAYAIQADGFTTADAAWAAYK